MGTGFPPARSLGTVPSGGKMLRRAKAGRIRSCTNKKSLDELIGIKLLDRRLLLDDAFRQIEVLQLRQPFGIDLAELCLPDIDELGVVVERGLHGAFLALPFRHERHELERGLVGV